MLNIIYLILLIFFSAKVFFQLKGGKFTSMLAIDLFMLVYYAIPLYTLSSSNGFNFARVMFYEPSWMGLSCVILFYLSAYIANNSYKSKKNFYYYIPNEEMFVKNTTLFVLVLSTVLFLLYCSLFGGFTTVMLNISSIRSGVLVSNNAKLEFVIKLYPVVVFAPVLLLPFWRSACSGSKNIKKWYIITSVIIAFIIRLSTGSRGAFLTLFLLLIVGSIVSSNRFSQLNPLRKMKKGNTKKYLFIVVVAIFAIVLLRPLLYYFNDMYAGSEADAEERLTSTLFASGGRYSILSPKDLLMGLIYSFSHYANGLELALDKVYSGQHENNYFMEFLVTLQSVIPTKLLGITKMQSVTYYNSLYLGYDGNMPPGIIGSAVYSGGIPWVVFYGLLVGYIGKRIDIFYNRMKKHVTFASYYYVALWFQFFFISCSGDFASQFAKALTTFMLIFYIYIKLKKIAPCSIPLK